MVDFPTLIPALLDLFIPSGASICSTVAFSLLGNFNYAVASVFIHFPSSSKCKIALLMTILVLIGMVFVIIWEIPWEDIFRLRALIQQYAWSCLYSSGASKEFWALIFFICYVATPQPALGHYQGSNLVLITAFCLCLTKRSPRASYRSWVPKPGWVPSGVWTGNHLICTQHRNPLRHSPFIEISWTLQYVSMNLVFQIVRRSHLWSLI